MTLRTPTPELDVVIPTRDRPEQLVTTLEALTGQSFKNFGVIVVDDGSETAVEAQVPRSLRDELGIRFVRNDKSLGAGTARNRGVELSPARYVVLIDDDCIAGPQLIRKHHHALSAVDVPTVSLGPISSIPGQRLPVWSLWDADHLERGYEQLANGEVGPGWQHLFTGNVGLRREDFLAAGGFDERLARNEDVELGYRLARYGCRFEFDSAAWVWHDCQRTLRSWMRIAAAAALSDVEMHQCNPDSDRLAQMLEQLQAKHWALRFVRRFFGGPVAGTCVIAGAMGSGFLLHAVRVDRPAMFAFSVVHDLTYWRSLRRSLPRNMSTVRRATEETG